LFTSPSYFLHLFSSYSYSSRSSSNGEESAKLAYIFHQNDTNHKPALFRSKMRESRSVLFAEAFLANEHQKLQSKMRHDTSLLRFKAAFELPAASLKVASPLSPWRLGGGNLFFSSAAAANQHDFAAGALPLLLERGRGEPVSDLLPLRLGLGRVAVRRAAAGDAVRRIRSELSI
jgi:hypothetical protein